MHTYLEPPSSEQHQGREPKSTARSIPWCCHSAFYRWSVCMRDIRVFKVCVWECVCVFFMCEYCGFWLGVHTLKASRWCCVCGAVCICVRCHPYRHSLTLYTLMHTLLVHTTAHTHRFSLLLPEMITLHLYFLVSADLQIWLPNRLSELELLVAKMTVQFPSQNFNIAGLTEL